MFELCRKIVAGPKKKLQWNGKQLDLTYVTDRIIAMAYPASGLEKAYRNSIKDVSNFLQEKHGTNYMIVNVSSRKYDYKYFNNNVLEYQWRDHLSPPLSTLFQISRQIFQFLKKNKSNIVAVHCNHGKGRTGTTIICFLLFTGFFQKYDEALSFYNKRRFISLTYGVSQPCQKRYLNYFEMLRSSQKVNCKLICYKVKGIKQKGLEKDKHFIQITGIRNQDPKYRKLFFSENQSKIYPNIPLIGDICIQVFYDKWKGEQQRAIINSHTYFLCENQNSSLFSQETKEKLYIQKRSQTSVSILPQRQQKYESKNIKVNGKHPSDFQILIDFQWFCKCHLYGMEEEDCPCQQDRKVQQRLWKKTVESVEIARKITKLQACTLLFNIQYLNNETNQKQEINLQQLSSSKGTQTSPLQGQQKWQFSSEKDWKKQPFSNSFSISQGSNEHQNDSLKLKQEEQFQYDMIVVNRNSANSV